MINSLFLSLRIARRYLFAKKSHKAVNLVSGVSLFGVVIASMAMICTLSVFNGFQGFVEQMFTAFDAPLRIERTDGRHFNLDDRAIADLMVDSALAVVVPTLESQVLVGYKGRQVVAMAKGVGAQYRRVTGFEPLLIDGSFRLKDSLVDYGIMGAGLAYNLQINCAFVDPFEVYVARKGASISMAAPEKAFNSAPFFLSGVFRLGQPEYDNHWILLDYDVLTSLMGVDREATALEVSPLEGSDVEVLRRMIVDRLGSDYVVKNRYEQQISLFRMMEIEKWVTFLILLFILLIAAFNIIGSLSMLILEKQADTSILKAMGADDRMIDRVFLFEGWLISGVGSIIGIGLGVLLCLAQQQFGLLKLGDAFLMENYPVEIRLGDLFLVVGVVLSMGFVTAWIPVIHRHRIK